MSLSASHHSSGQVGHAALSPACKGRIHPSRMHSRLQAGLLPAALLQCCAGTARTVNCAMHTREAFPPLNQRSKPDQRPGFMRRSGFLQLVAWRSSRLLPVMPGLQPQPEPVCSPRGTGEPECGIRRDGTPGVDDSLQWFHGRYCTSMVRALCALSTSLVPCPNPITRAAASST